MKKSFRRTATRVAGITICALLCAASSGISAGADANPKKVYDLPGIVVVADLAETPLDQIGSSVTVISRDDIERSQKTTVLELLRRVPGLDVVQSGGPGSQTSVFMRGGGSEHTLVLIDGVEMNDPSATGSYDFSALSTDNIERIEILRGSQSVLYGSDAMSGVISIITREGKGAPEASFRAEAGSFNSKRFSGFVSSSKARVSYTLGASRFVTDGISATTVSGGGTPEDDAFARTSVSGRMRYRVSPSVSASLSLRALDSEHDFDKGFASFSSGVREDPNLANESRQLFAQSTLEYLSPDSRWRISGAAALTSIDRETLDLPDNVFGPGASNSFSEGEKVKFRGLVRFESSSRSRIVAGLETEREQMSQTFLGPFPSFIGGANSRTSGAFVTGRISLGDRIFVNGGVRYDDHETFGGKTTYRLTGSFRVGESGTRFRGSYSTGFNAPALFQLFDATFGNPNLFPEKSESWEIGIDQSALSERLSLGALWFKSEFTDMFGFDPNTFQTININSTTAEGAELYAQYRRRNISARLDYTYTKSTDEADGAQLVRRPKNKLSGRAAISPSEQLSASLSVTHVGSRADLNFDIFPSERVRLDPYTLVMFGASYQFSDMWRLFGRIENVFDEEYEEVLFFGTPGRAVYAGLRLTP